jgi:hypothetical protein
MNAARPCPCASLFSVQEHKSPASQVASELWLWNQNTRRVDDNIAPQGYTDVVAGHAGTSQGLFEGCSIERVFLLLVPVLWAVTRFPTPLLGRISLDWSDEWNAKASFTVLSWDDSSWC